METEYGKTAAVFKAFCDESRLRVLKQLRDGEKCACVLIERLGIGQSALSYHMKILTESGIVCARQEGKWTHYHICAEGCARAAELLQELTTPNILQEPSECCD